MTNYKINMEITPQMISDLMISVVESSYSPWVGQITFKGKYGEAKTFDNTGLGLICEIEYDREEDREGTYHGRMKITRKTVQRGLQAMLTECPKAIASILDENWDAITADCFFQCVVFGRVVYG